MNKEELLNALLDDKVYADTLLARMEEMQNKKYLAEHKYTIWQNQDGKWVTYINDNTKRKQISAVTKEKLETKIINYYKSLEDNPTLNDCFNLWIEEKLKTDICKGTYDRYKNDYLRFFNNTEIQNKKIKYITENDLTCFVKTQIKELKLSNKAYANLRTILMGIFKYAKTNKYTDISISVFFKDLELSRKIFTNKPKDKYSQVYIDDEIGILINKLCEYKTIMAYAIAFDFYTGLRVGELCCIKWSDINGNDLHIQRQLIVYKDRPRHCNRVVVDYTKSEAGYRHIILTEKALEVLNAVKSINRNQTLVFGANNKPICDSSFNNILRKACNDCGIKYRSMHKIRKTYGTTLIDNDVDDSFITEQMGHSDINTTRKYYYYSNKNRDKYKKQLDKALGY